MSGKSEGDTRQTTKEDILDATCGGRSIWLPGNKRNENTLYIDNREREPGFTGHEGRTYGVEPDEVQDFRDLSYNDEEFSLIVFDPPHIVRPDGMKKLTGHVSRTYGALHAETWQSDLRSGFEELWRVLKPDGTLVFKFGDTDVDFQYVLDLAPMDPLFGTTTKKTSTTETRWFVFHKHD